MTPEEFKALVRRARSVRELDGLMGVEFGQVQGSLVDLAECWRVAFAAWEGLECPPAARGSALVDFTWLDAA